MVELAADDVQDECIARDLLVRLYLDDVARLNAAPVTDLETLVPLRKDELLHRLAVDLLRGLLELLVMEKIEAACRDNTRTGNEDHVGVVLCLALPRDHLRAEVHQQNHVVKLKQCFVEKYRDSPDTLHLK